MNPIVLLLADGNALFLGMLTAIIALIARWWLKNSVALALARIIGIIGVTFVFASSTPFPVWVYCIWFALWFTTFVLPVTRTKRLIFPSFLMVSVILCILEIPFHQCPAIPVGKDQHVYVLGDSISAGMGTSERNWPLVLGDISHLQVTNLAQPGATAATALSQESGIIVPYSLVIIEIGGNDLLGTAFSDEFAKSLDNLLRGIPSSSYCAMFELPLFPFHSGYGEVQRTLAKRYNVILIPKKVLTNVIGGSGNTLDGLHLSQQGHDALARAVFRMLVITP